MPANQCLEKLMSDYGDAILRMCYLYLKDYQLAEDATQETFIKAMKSYKSFEHRSSEKTWLTRIAINCCKNIMRTRWFQVIRNHNGDLQRARTENLIDELLEKTSVSNAIMKLNASDRKVIILYYYQELPMKDIAAIIGVNINAASQRLNRARKRLKEILKEDGFGVGYETTN